MHRARRILRLGTSILAFSLEGCASRGAPSLTLFGVYFPSWLFCGLIGIGVAIAARVLFVQTGWTQFIPMQLSVCVAIGATAAVAAWAFWLGP